MKYSWELSSFDTEILGFKTAKITYVEFGAISNLKTDLTKHGIIYATYRVPANNYLLIQNLEENEFILVDSLLTLAINNSLNQKDDFTFIKKAEQEDYSQIVDLAGRVFRGVSRYYHDLIIPTEKGDIIYRKWMENSLKGVVADLVLVWKDKQDILGFITLQKKGQIPLFAVSEKARGRGISKKLIFAALYNFKKWGLDKILIETQSTNIPALRLYHSCGFKIIQSYLTFRWHVSLA